MLVEIFSLIALQKTLKRSPVPAQSLMLVALINIFILLRCCHLSLVSAFTGLARVGLNAKCSELPAVVSTAILSPLCATSSLSSFYCFGLGAGAVALAVLPEMKMLLELKPVGNVAPTCLAGKWPASGSLSRKIVLIAGVDDEILLRIHKELIKNTKSRRSLRQCQKTCRAAL